MTETSIEALQERFSIAGVAQIVGGNGGLPKIRVNIPAGSTEIYLHGAQVTSWQPSGADEVLFVSRQSRWEDGRAIRGGIPICFPWFRGKADNAKAPAHGMVRTKSWHLDALAEEGDTVSITLSTESDDASRRWWPHAFHVAHRITIGTELKLELTVTHLGSAEEEPMQFEEALHTYFAVSDATKVRVAGLDEVAFLDNMDANREKTQLGDMTFRQPVDSAYLHTTAAVELIDPGLSFQRRLRTVKENSLSTVVWNPWKEGAAALADMSDAEWQQMACVEAANILDNAVTLAPGQRHTIIAHISVTQD